MRVLLFFGLVLAGLSNPALGAGEQKRALESSRFLGRGNTWVAAPDSDEATRANPATLSETKIKFQLRWLQMDVFVGDNSLDSISGISNFSGDESAISMLNTFEDKFGKRQYGRFQLSPLALRIMYFEMSPFASSTNFIDMRLPTTPEIIFESDSLVGMNFAFGIPMGNTLNLGMTLRPAHRTLFTGDMAFADLLDFIEADDFGLEDLFDKREGMQIGWDVGAIWKPGKDWRFGAVVENTGYAGNYGDFKDPPPPQQQRVNLGSMYRMDLKPWHLDLFADVQDVVNPNQYHLLQLIHLGTELGRSYISRDHDMGLLFGINEGYFTSGAFVDVWLARLNVSYYAVELGEYPGQRRDRRWGVTLISSMTF